MGSKAGFLGLVSRCALAAGVAPAFAAAPDLVSETDFYSDQPIVLSASRLVQPLQDAPAAVTVIDRAMIRASGFRDIPDLLRLVPGFTVAYTRDNTWAIGYHGLADAYSRRLQVLVDGRSIYSAHIGEVYWADLPLSIDDIDRIEVVRGPNAASFGANAFLAVINIITRDSAQSHGSFASLQAGTRDTRGLTVRHGGGDDALQYRLTASAQQRDRFDRTVTWKAERDNGEYFEATDTYLVNGRMDWQLAPHSTLMAQFGVSQGDWEAGRRLDDPLQKSALEPTEQDSRAQYLQFAYTHVQSASREWRVQAYHSRNRLDAEKLSYDGDVILREDLYRLQTRSNVELQVNDQLSDALRAVWGAEVRHESVIAPNEFDSGETFSGVLWRTFGNLEWRATEQLLLQGGAMLEHHYFTGFDVSPRVALNYTLQPGHALRVSVSQAYRSPTFYDQYRNVVERDIDGNFVDREEIPAAEILEPERILSREIGYIGQITPLALGVNARAYYDTLFGYIGSQRVTTAACDEPVPYRCFQYINGSSIDLRGWETEFTWRPVKGLEFAAHYAHTRISYREIVYGGGRIIDRDLPDSAPHRVAGLLARYAWGAGWLASAGVYRVDRMMWLSDGDWTEDYNRVDVRLARTWKWDGREVEAAVVGQNLGDDYEEFRDTNRFSQRAYASLSFRVVTSRAVYNS